MFQQHVTYDADAEIAPVTEKPRTTKQIRAAKREEQRAYDAARYEKRKLGTECRCGKAKESGALCCSTCEPADKRRRAEREAERRARFDARGECPTCRLSKQRNTMVSPAVISALGFHTERGPKSGAIGASRTGARRGGGKWKTELHNGKRSMRFVGQGKRGSPSKAVNDEQDRKQIEATLERGFQLLKALEDPSVQLLPKSERKSAEDAGCAQLKLVQRFLDEILRRHGYES
jgi:hypothetical protein